MHAAAVVVLALVATASAGVLLTNPIVRTVHVNPAPVVVSQPLVRTVAAPVVVSQPLVRTVAVSQPIVTRTVHVNPAPLVRTVAVSQPIVHHVSPVVRTVAVAQPAVYASPAITKVAHGGLLI